MIGAQPPAARVGVQEAVVNQTETAADLLRQIMRRLWPLWPYWLVGTVFTLAGSWASVAIAAMQKDVLDLISAAELSGLYRVLIVWGIALVAANGAAILGFYLVGYGSALAVNGLRRETLDHILSLPLPTVEERHTGDLVSRAHSDASVSIGSMTNNVVTIAWAVVSAILAFIYLARIHLPLTIAVTLAGPLLFWVGRLFDTRLRRASEALQKNEAAVRSWLQEDLQGMEVIRAYGLEGWAQAQFAGLRDENKRLSLRLALSQNLLWTLNGVTFLLTGIVASALVALAAMAGNITAGSLLAFLILVNRLTGPFAQVSNGWGNLQQGLGAARRVFEILRLPTERAVGPQAQLTEGLTATAGLPATRAKASPRGEAAVGWGLANQTSGTSGQPAEAAAGAKPQAEPVAGASRKLVTPVAVLEFAGVSFVHANSDSARPLLKDLSFRVEPNEMVGLVGESGSGKSTIARLALGLYWPTTGVVRVCGHDTRTELDQARAAAAYVPQRPYLFGGTVAENVTCGYEIHQIDQPAGRGEGLVQLGVELGLGLGLDELFAQLPQGESTIVGEQGVRLSGGQRQRVAIARALLRRARLFVLDEATSNLDNETEVAIKQLLNRARGVAQAGMLVIAHRLTTVAEADRILVLKDGRIVEEGTHEQLLRRQGEYSRLWKAAR